jgi:hypothetical protein
LPTKIKASYAVSKRTKRNGKKWEEGEWIKPILPSKTLELGQSCKVEKNHKRNTMAQEQKLQNKTRFY